MRAQGTSLRRAGVLAYGIACYAAFLASFLYAIGFVANLWPRFGWQGSWLRSVDFGGPAAPPGVALAIDLLLLGLFAVQHSVMARAGFKRWWTRRVPAEIERSSYVLASSACLGLLFWQWRPIAAPALWEVSAEPWAALLVGLSMLGWLAVLVSTLLIDHFELFGLRQVWAFFRGRTIPEAGFCTPGFYKALRHPIYLGFLVAFWATPRMSPGHLVFAAATTGYVLLAIRLEERDLIRRFGEEYRRYRRTVPMLLPLPRRLRGARPAS